MSRRIAVLGAGSWGTALADVLARNGHEVRLWAWSEELADDLRRTRRNERYLPGVDLDPRLDVGHELDTVLSRADAILSVSPSHYVRSVMSAAAPHIAREALLISASKGLELETSRRMSEVLYDVLPANLANGVVVLSGPSFAAELARGLPTAVTLASSNTDNAMAVQEMFQSDRFRLYTQSDVIGTEVGGALKNVMAIAAGISDGLGLGNNARAALLTRGLAEMGRLAETMGGQAVTLAGLAGMGDLVLTCTGSLSRNRHVGVELARGRSLDDVLSGMKMVAEGVRTTDAALALGARHGVELPITAQVAELLAGRKDARTALYDLMLRPQRAEAG